MEYDFFQVRFNLKKNALFYIFLTLELLLCSLMILIGFDENRAYRRRQEIYTNPLEQDLLTLTNENWFLEAMDLSSKQGGLTDEPLLLGQVYHLEWIARDGTIQNAQLLAANDLFFDHYFGERPDAACIYLTESLQKELATADGFLSANVCLAGSDDDFSTSGVPSPAPTRNVPAEKVNSPAASSPSSTPTSLQWNQHDYAMRPLAQLQPRSPLPIPTSPLESGDINPERTLFLLLPDDEQGEALFGFIKLPRDQASPDLLGKLAPLVGQKLYASDLLADFEKGSESQAAFVRLFGWVAWIALLVVVFGTAAMILVFLANRREKLHVEVLFGAKPARLRFQTFLELFMVFLVAYLLALLLRSFLEPVLSSAYYQIRPEARTASLLLILLVVTCILITVFASRANEEARKGKRI